MRCPRCSTENPEGRGFCIACAFPLPEEPRKPEPSPQAPWYPDPAATVSQAMTNGWGAPPQAPTRPRRRVLPGGIVSFGLGIEALGTALVGIMMILLMDAVSSSLPYSYAGVGFTASTMLITYALLSLGGGIAGLILGIKAVSKSSVQPDLFAVRGLYRAGVVLSAIGAVLGLVLLVVAILA